jgi:hypothetical protein
MKLSVAEFKRWQEWSRCIQVDIENHVVHPRQVFRGVTEVVNANREHLEKHEGDVFFSFLRQCYVSHIAMSIRRHIKVDNGISLMRLLGQIHDCANQFTYEFYLQRFPIDPSYVNWQSVTFAPFSDDGKAVSAARVEKDMDDLKALTAQVEILADRTIAHLDKGGFAGAVTFDDLNACIDCFDRLFCKYLKLTTASGYATLEPTIICEWQKIFTVPFDLRN